MDELTTLRHCAPAVVMRRCPGHARDVWTNPSLQHRRRAHGQSFDGFTQGGFDEIAESPKTTSELAYYGVHWPRCTRKSQLDLSLEPAYPKSKSASSTADGALRCRSTLTAIAQALDIPVARSEYPATGVGYINFLR